MAEGVKLIQENRGDLLHLDVMDGNFVPNISFGPKMVRDLSSHAKIPLDTHLMIDHPERYIRDFADAGSDLITIHYEAEVHVHRTLTMIKEIGKKAGISIVPSTPAFLLDDLLPFVDLILIMSVNPGFGGQKMIPESLAKIRYLAAQREKKGLSYVISVDGGINRTTAPSAIEAGADILVLGSAFFSADDPSVLVEELKGLR